MTRVVVVGNGMVGSRFVEDLLQASPDAEVTVVGAEEYEPYNRVLLSEVVAGAVDVASLTLPRPVAVGGRIGPEVRAGVVALGLDRDRRTVRTDAGEMPYDVVVLATGARARIPAVPGLDPLPAGAHALRTLDDAREIVAATVNLPRAVVLGGGVLGLEAACGLAARGLEVTVLHPGPHLMDRQLGTAPAAAAAQTLRRLGIDQRTGAGAAEVLLEGGAVAGVRLTTGEVLAAELLLVTAGTVPETEIAASAGLAVRRGVVVDGSGRTADPRVFAIGDCAEPPEGSSGLIAQGWDQARRLARHLADGWPAIAAGEPDDEDRASATITLSDVVRLKARGLEVVTMGVCGDRTEIVAGQRRIALSDPAAGRHVEVVVADGLLVGATCVGAGALGADLVAAYTRRTPVPADPAQLLLKPVPGAAAVVAEPSPTLMPDRATVCRCNGVTKGDIVACWRHGARSTEDVARVTRATTGCGGCTDAVCGIVDWLAQADPPQATDGATAAGAAASRTTAAPGAAGADIAASGAAGPYIAASGAAGPDMAASGAAGPDMAAPGAAGPDMAASGAAGGRGATALARVRTP